MKDNGFNCKANDAVLCIGNKVFAPLRPSDNVRCDFTDSKDHKQQFVFSFETKRKYDCFKVGDLIEIGLTDGKINGTVTKIKGKKIYFKALI